MYNHKMVTDYKAVVWLCQGDISKLEKGVFKDEDIIYNVIQPEDLETHLKNPLTGETQGIYLEDGDKLHYKELLLVPEGDFRTLHTLIGDDLLVVNSAGNGWYLTYRGTKCNTISMEDQYIEQMLYNNDFM